MSLFFFFSVLFLSSALEAFGRSASHQYLCPLNQTFSSGSGLLAHLISLCHLKPNLGCHQKLFLVLHNNFSALLLLSLALKFCVNSLVILEHSRMLDDGVDVSSAVESNEVRVESPAMASFHPSSSLASAQSVVVKVQTCQASSQSSAQTDPSLQAHDYIGLCEVSSRAEASACVGGQQQSMLVNLQETELRLGLPDRVPFQPKQRQGPSIDATQDDELEAAGGQPSMVARSKDHALLEKIVKPCANPLEIPSEKYMKEVGDAGMPKAFLRSESFKRSGEDNVEGRNLGIGLHSESMAYPQEEVGENKVSYINGRFFKISTLDFKDLQDLAALENDNKLPSKNASHQQLDAESTRQEQLLQNTVKGEAEYGVVCAAHKFWQAHMMVRAADATYFPNQSHQELETSSATFKRALDCINGVRILPTTTNHAMAGAKRVFAEAIGNSAAPLNGATKMVSSEVMGAAESESKLFKQQLPSSIISWGSSRRPLASWQSGLNLPDGAAPCEQFPSPGKALPKGDASMLPLKHCLEALTKKSLGKGPPPDLAHGMQDTQFTEEDTIASTPRAPVGWPPVQSFRKNSLPPPTPKKLVPPPLSPLSPQSTRSESLFVKVYMDGLPFGRKLDLRTVNNYDKLSMALEGMFKGFMNGQSGDNGRGHPPCSKEKKLNYLCNSEYVVAYEDKDGDLMLVGDVPWGMFILTVKRLRIMKGSGAIGLAPRPADKAKCS